MKMSSGMRYEFVSRSFLLEHLVPFEFQKGKSEGVAWKWTAGAQEVDAGLCQRQS